MKYYAVYKGKSVIPKIYTSWDECKKDVIGFKGAIYKSFTTEKEAKEFISLNSQGKKLENIQDEESENYSIEDDFGQGAGSRVWSGGINCLSDDERGSGIFRGLRETRRSV